MLPTSYPRFFPAAVTAEAMATAVRRTFQGGPDGRPIVYTSDLGEPQVSCPRREYFFRSCLSHFS
eukprot:426932-Prymnesium_polylepis.1